MSFEDEISALIDRPCRRDGCGRTLPEWCPSDDFCSETCETTWRAENNGCKAVDYGEFGIDVQVPDGHPAAPSYTPPQEGAFAADRPPRSFLEYMHRRLSQLWDRLILGDPEQTPEIRGILSATERPASPPPSPAYGLMQIMPSRWERDVPFYDPARGELTERRPAVPPSTAEVQRMREQIARIYGIPLPMISPPPPPARTTWVPPGEPQVLNELGTPPVNLTAPPFLAFDPAVPDAVPLLYTMESRYDRSNDRVVLELRVRVPPQPPWINVQFDGAEFVRSLRTTAETVAERQQLLHGTWTEERLEGAGLEELGAEVEEPPDIPPYRDQSET